MKKSKGKPVMAMVLVFVKKTYESTGAEPVLLAHLRKQEIRLWQTRVKVNAETPLEAALRCINHDFRKTFKALRDFPDALQPGDLGWMGRVETLAHLVEVFNVVWLMPEALNKLGTGLRHVRLGPLWKETGAYEQLTEQTLLGLEVQKDYWDPGNPISPSRMAHPDTPLRQ